MCKCTICHLTDEGCILRCGEGCKGQRLAEAVLYYRQYGCGSKLQCLAKQESIDPSTELVNKIIAHAQHILWAQAILLCLPPVALLTKKRALCLSSNYREDHFRQETKRMKRNRQKNPFPFLYERAEGYENHLVCYFRNSFPYPWRPEGGQAALANFLTGSHHSEGDRDTNPSSPPPLLLHLHHHHLPQPPSSPTPTPLTILRGAVKPLTRTDREMNRYEEKPPKNQ